MQRDLASLLQQKSHLASLGLAVSKINHDLRNLLSSAQLFSDRLSAIPDPKVPQFAPKLMRSLERAIAFCQSTLSYWAAHEPAPDRKPVAFEPLVEEVRETLGAQPESGIRWIYSIDFSGCGSFQPIVLASVAAYVTAAKSLRLVSEFLAYEGSGEGL